MDLGSIPLRGGGHTEYQRRYRAKTELALEMLRRARALGHLSAEWAAGDDAFGMSPVFRDGLTAERMQYVLDVPPDTPVWPRNLPGAVRPTTDEGVLPSPSRGRRSA